MEMETVDLLPIPVLPVIDALDLFHSAIEKRSTAFNVHTASAAFHISCFTARDTLFEKLSSGKLVSLDEEMSILIPAATNTPGAVSLSAEQVRTRLMRARKILCAAHPEYGALDYNDFNPLICFRSDPLSASVKLSRAFEELCHWGILPVTTGNVLFTPLSAVMIMMECLWEDDDLVCFLRHSGPVYNQTLRKWSVFI